MNCCNANGVCGRGEDCPARKQRIKETNDAYINCKAKVSNPDPYADTIGTVKELISAIAVTCMVGIAVLTFWAWVKS